MPRLVFPPAFCFGCFFHFGFQPLLPRLLPSASNLLPHFLRCRLKEVSILFLLFCFRCISLSFFNFFYLLLFDSTLNNLFVISKVGVVKEFSIASVVIHFNWESVCNIKRDTPNLNAELMIGCFHQSILSLILSLEPLYVCVDSKVFFFTISVFQKIKVLELKRFS